MEFEQAHQFHPVGGGAGLLGKVFQDHAGIIGAAEEGAINAAADVLMHLRSAPQQSGPEHRAQCNAGGLVHFHDGLQVAGEGEGKQQRQPDTDQRKQNRKSPLHQQVARAALQQHRNFEHLMHNYGVGKGQSG